MEKFRLKPKTPTGYLTLKETAQYLKVSTKTVTRYIKNRGLPAKKPAGIYLINKEELQKWVDENGQ